MTSQPATAVSQVDRDRPDLLYPVDSARLACSSQNVSAGLQTQDFAMACMTRRMTTGSMHDNDYDEALAFFLLQALLPSIIYSRDKCV